MCRAPSDEAASALQARGRRRHAAGADAVRWFSIGRTGHAAARRALDLSRRADDRRLVRCRGDRNYNRPVRHPYPASAERLWRADGLYDVVVVLGYNDRPRIRDAAAPSSCTWRGAGYAPTEGCIALARRDLRRLLGVRAARQ